MPSSSGAKQSPAQNISVANDSPWTFAASAEDVGNEQVIEEFEAGPSRIPFNLSDPLPPVREAPLAASEEELAEKLRQRGSINERKGDGHHFMEIVCGRKFLNWSLSSVVGFLNLSDLNIESEADVLCAAVRWLSANWAVRSAFVETVMTCVRFGLMNELTLLSALYNPMTATVLAEPYARECIFRAIACHRARRLGLTALIYRLQSRNRYRLRSTRKGFHETSTNKAVVVSGCFLCPPVEPLHSKKSKKSPPSSDENVKATGTEEEIEASQKDKEGARRGTTDFAAVRMWAASVIQAWYRGVRERRCLVLLHLAVGIVQAVWRGKRQRRLYLRQKRAAITIQAWWRGYLARKELAITQLAAIIIQTAWRGYLAREAFLLAKEAVTIIAAAWRGYKVRKNLKCMNIAACIIQRIYRGYRSRKEINLCRPSATCMESCVGQMLVSPPMAMPNTDAILVIGGGNPLESTKCSTRGRALIRYDPLLCSWRVMGYLPSCRFFAAGVSVGDSVVITGGCETFKLPPSPSRSVWRLDVVRGTWQNLSPMLAARLFHCVVAVGEVVLAMGGKTWGQRLLGSVESLGHSQGRWRPRASLLRPRFGMAATVHNARVWVCGGLEKSGILKLAVPTDELECYDLETDRWTVGRARLRFPRIFSSLVSVPGGLLLVGGATKEVGTAHSAHLMSIAAVDYLAEDETNWKLHGELATARHHAHGVYVGERVLVVGGVIHQEEVALAGVECCYVSSGHAKIGMETDLPFPITGHSCVILRRHSFVSPPAHAMLDSFQEREIGRPPAGKAKRLVKTPPPPHCRSSSSSSSSSLLAPSMEVEHPTEILVEEKQAATAALMMEHVRALTEEWARRGWPEEELVNPSSVWEDEEEDRMTEEKTLSQRLTAKSLGPLCPCSNQTTASLQ